MYANVKDRKIAGVFTITGTGIVAGSTVDLRTEPRIVEQFAVLMKGYGSNLISPTVLNGGFETAGGGGADVFADWVETVQGTTAISQTAVAGEFHGGANGMKIVVDAVGTFIGAVEQDVLVSGKAYSGSLWAKGAVGGETIQVFNQATLLAEFVLTNAFAQYTIPQFTANAVKLIVMTKANAVNDGATLYIDDITITDLVGFDLAPTAFAGALEASLDGGAHWTTLQAVVHGNDGTILFISGKPVDYFRLNVTTFTKAGDASDYATFSYLGA